MPNAPLSAGRGNKFGIGFFHWALKLFGINRPCEFVWAVCLYYLLFDREAVRSAMPYARHRFPGAGWLKRMWCVYRIFVSNGQAMVVCAANTAGHELSVEFGGLDKVKEYLAVNSEGVIIVTSHFGNWQTAMTNLYDDLGRPVSFLMLPEQNEAVLNAMRHNPQLNSIRVIPADSEMGGMLEIMEAVQSGEAVCIMADRAVNERIAEVEFLGDKAQFPYTAFFLAAELKCPVVPLFVFRHGKKHGRLKVLFGELIHPVIEKRGNITGEMSKYVAEYVGELENMTEAYPFQCYLFQDVWGSRTEKT